jgi:uncharacterized protein (TIRG00374 family)
MFIGLLVFALYLYFFVGFGQIVQVAKGVNAEQYAFFYALAICSIVIGNFLWAASWRSALRTLSVKISMKNAFLYYWTGYFVDLVVPCETICGEVTRLYLVRKETNENFGAIAAGGITNRIVAYIIVVAGLYSSALLLFLKSSIPALILSFLILIIVGASAYLAVLLYLAFSDKAASKITSLIMRLRCFFRPKKYKSKDLSPETQENLAAFYQGFKTFREHPRHLVKPFIFMTLSFLLNLVAYILVFFALGIQSQPFAFFIIIYFIAGSITDAAASFSVGTLEILLSTIFIFYGLNPALSGITAVLVRSVTFWFPLILGYIIVQIVGAKKLLAPNPQKAPLNKPTSEPVISTPTN